jgi:multiple sugar transport system substrate-binding protein
LGLLSNKKDYPRDWKFGVVEAPTPDGASVRNNMANIAYEVVNKNAKNPKAAYEYVKFLAEEAYKYNGNTPGRVDLKVEDYSAMFKDSLDKAGNDVTVEELYKAVIDNGMGLVSEKIGAPISNEYSGAVIKESEAYLFGQKKLEDAVKSVKETADKAISEAQK